jgi:hypothetical protein
LLPSSSAGHWRCPARTAGQPWCTAWCSSPRCGQPALGRPARTLSLPSTAAMPVTMARSKNASHIT